jgi:carboxylesterase type B
MILQIQFTCPAGEAVSLRRNTSIPAWRYHYEGEFLSISFACCSQSFLAVFRDISLRPDLRAYHSSELPIVFGTYNQTTTVAKTPKEMALSRYMQSAWVAFARDPQKGLSNFGWPTYDPTSNSLIQLGNFFNPSSAAFGRGDQLDLVCSKIDTLAAISAQVLSLF